MGNSALIVVLASVFSGILIFLNIQRINTEANIVQTHLQDEVLARELAHNGHNLMLSRLYGQGGLQNAYGPFTISYEGGTITVGNYAKNDASGLVSFAVLGEYGEAQYMIQSEYGYGVDFPLLGAIESPNFNLVMDEEATINGGSRYGEPGFEAFNVGTSEFDRLESQPGLAGLIDLGQVETDINDALYNAWEGLPGEVTDVNIQDLDEAFSDALPDIDPNQDIPWIQELYYTSLDNMRLGPESNDALFPAPPEGVSEPAGSFGSANPESDLFGSNYAFGSLESTAIVRVDGDMVVHNGSTFTGAGLLIVEGDLTVMPGATLNWDGILYLRPEKPHSVTSLNGTVNLRGAMVAYQEALPPGSHMDVTTNRDLSGIWAAAKGTETSEPGIPIAGPWFVHIHKWDQPWFSRPAISPDREVILLENGSASPHEASVRFSETLSDIANLGIDQIQLKFVNPGQSGMGVFHMQLSDGTEYNNSIAAGFNGKSVSAPFAPSDLRSFGMHFRSVRFLQLMRDPDPEGSTYDGAQRVARDHNRKGSFRVAVYDYATGNLLMTTSVYQHIREDENEDYEAELEELRQDILDGNFGLTVEMGQGASLWYDEVAASSALKRTNFSTFSHEGTFTRRCNKSTDFNCDLSRDIQ